MVESGKQFESKESWNLSVFFTVETIKRLIRWSRIVVISRVDGKMKGGGEKFARQDIREKIEFPSTMRVNLNFFSPSSTSCSFTCLEQYLSISSPNGKTICIEQHKASIEIYIHQPQQRRTELSRDDQTGLRVQKENT